MFSRILIGPTMSDIQEVTVQDHVATALSELAILKETILSLQSQMSIAIQKTQTVTQLLLDGLNLNHEHS